MSIGDENKRKPEEQKASPMYLTEDQRKELREWIVMRDESTKACRLACAHIRRIEALGYIAFASKEDSRAPK